MSRRDGPGMAGRGRLRLLPDISRPGHRQDVRRDDPGRKAKVQPPGPRGPRPAQVGGARPPARSGAPVFVGATTSQYLLLLFWSKYDSRISVSASGPRKRLVIALAFTLCAVAGCNEATTSGAEPATNHPAPAALATPSPGPLIMWRVAAAAKAAAAAAEPHGEIGDAAVAT